MRQKTKAEILRGGEYCPPQLEILQIAVESGFAGSGWDDGETAPGDWNDWEEM